MPIVLDSDDIIELFDHSDQVGQNSQGVYIVPCAHKPPESFFFISEHGLEPIKKAISEAREGPIKSPSGTNALDLCKLIPADHAVYYYSIKSAVDSLSFAILVPGRYKIDLPQRKLIAVLSRIFQALTYAGQGWG